MLSFYDVWLYKNPTIYRMCFILYQFKAKPNFIRKTVNRPNLSNNFQKVNTDLNWKPASGIFLSIVVSSFESCTSIRTLLHCIIFFKIEFLLALMRYIRFPSLHACCLTQSRLTLEEICLKWNIVHSWSCYPIWTFRTLKKEKHQQSFQPLGTFESSLGQY